METFFHVPDVVQLDKLGPREDEDLDQLRLLSARLGARVPDSFCCPLVTMETWNLASRLLLLNLWELSSLRNPIKGMRLLPICSVSFFVWVFFTLGSSSGQLFPYSSQLRTGLKGLAACQRPRLVIDVYVLGGGCFLGSSLTGQ